MGHEVGNKGRKVSNAINALEFEIIRCASGWFVENTSPLQLTRRQPQMVARRANNAPGAVTHHDIFFLAALLLCSRNCEDVVGHNSGCSWATTAPLCNLIQPCA